MQRRLVSLLTPITVRSPADYYVNRARRGNLSAHLTLEEAGLLCVSSDTGEDHDRAREATRLLYSLQAGGLLETTEQAGRKCVEPAALMAVAARMTAVDLWSEAAGLWSGASAAIAGEVQRTDEHSTPELKLALIGISGAVQNRKGESIGWGEFIKLSALREAASLGVRGKFRYWRMSDVATWAAKNGYTFWKVQGSPKVVETDTSPFGQITRQLKRS